MLAPCHHRTSSAFATLLLFAGIAIAAWTSGCSSATTVRVVPSAAPAPSDNSGLIPLPDSHPKLPWVISETSRLTEPQLAKFAAAREAFWNYDTDGATKLLRELRGEDVIAAEHFHALMIQCYEKSRRWADLLPLFIEFDLEQSYSPWISFVKLMAGLPPRQIEFAAAPSPVPIALNSGDLVVADVEINGTRARLLVDTGCGLTWLSEKFARRAGVERFNETIRLSDGNGSKRDTPLALVRELRVGGLIVRNTPALAGRSVLLEMGQGVDGVLGWDILQNADVTWDFPAKLMTLAAPTGVMSAAPILSGRTGPILTVVSSAGRPLHVILDTGMHGDRAPIEFYDNDGVLAGKTPLAAFRKAWRPTFGVGMHSFSISWPRLAKPFDFWMAGYRFEVPCASLERGEHKQEEWEYVDGVIGNAPFLGGKLHLCGVRREVSFELAPPSSLPPRVAYHSK